MRNIPLETARRATLSLVLGCMVAAASSQSFPSKLISLRVAFPAGGAADAGFRQVQPLLQQSLGQTVIIENFPGAGGSIGAMNVLNAPADGYVLLGTTGSDLTLAPLSISSAKYDPSSFKLVGTIAVTEFVLVSSPSHNFKNVDELIAYSKTPGVKELSIGHWGRGSSPHVVGADFQLRTNVKLLEIPYKGVAPIIPDIIGSQLDLTFLPLGGPTLGLIKTGKVRAIGVAGSARNRFLPDVPTLNEGKTLRGFEYSIWSGLFAPAKTPDSALAKLTAALAEAMKTPAYQKFLEDTASKAGMAGDLAQAASFYRSEGEKMTKIAISIKLQPE